MLTLRLLKFYVWIWKYKTLNISRNKVEDQVFCRSRYDCQHQDLDELLKICRIYFGQGYGIAYQRFVEEGLVKGQVYTSFWYAGPAWGYRQYVNLKILLDIRLLVRKKGTSLNSWTNTWKTRIILTIQCQVYPNSSFQLYQEFYTVIRTPEVPFANFITCQTRHKQWIIAQCFADFALFWNLF